MLTDKQVEVAFKDMLKELMTRDGPMETQPKGLFSANMDTALGMIAFCLGVLFAGKANAEVGILDFTEEMFRGMIFHRERPNTPSSGAVN